MKKKIKSESGFTIIELLIAALLTGIITFAAMDSYLNQHQQFLAQEQVADIQQRARAILDQVSFDIRQGGFNIPDTLAAMVVYSNGNGPDTLAVAHHGDLIEYYIDDSDTTHPSFMRSVNGNAQIFADNIEGFEITVLAGNLVDVEVTARSDKVDDFTAHDYRRRTYSSRVKLRNIN
jgi:Tfp pilus assembly protein PilW